MKREERIARYERALDELTAAEDALEAALAGFAAAEPLRRALEAYYTGPAWRRDLAADEAGRLPPGLKRGVLSQDAVWDALERAARLERLIHHKEEGI